MIEYVAFLLQEIHCYKGNQNMLQRIGFAVSRSVVYSHRHM